MNAYGNARQGLRLIQELMWRMPLLALCIAWPVHPASTPTAHGYAPVLTQAARGLPDLSMDEYLNVLCNSWPFTARTAPCWISDRVSASQSGWNSCDVPSWAQVLELYFF